MPQGGGEFSSPCFYHMLKVENICKSFKDFWGRKKVVLKNISFEVEKGEIFGLIGPNGAGKTTTFKICIGLLKPDKGKVYFEIEEKKEIKSKIGFLPELPYLYEYLTGKEYLLLILQLYGKKKEFYRKLLKEICEKFKIEDIIEKPIKTYSRGQRQKIGMAGIFIHEPEILILDEPLSGLDPVSRKEMKEILKEEKNKGKTILFSSHILSDAEEICDKIGIINKGEIVIKGKLDEIIPIEKKRVKIIFRYKENVKQIFKNYEQTREGYCIKVSENELNDALEKILKDRKGEILKINVETPTLEEIFYELIKNEN